MGQPGPWGTDCLCTLVSLNKFSNYIVNFNKYEQLLQRWCQFSPRNNQKSSWNHTKTSAQGLRWQASEDSSYHFPNQTEGYSWRSSLKHYSKLSLFWLPSLCLLPKPQSYLFITILCFLLPYISWCWWQAWDRWSSAESFCWVLRRPKWWLTVGKKTYKKLIKQTTRKG